MEHLWSPWRMPYLRGEGPEIEGCLFCVSAEMDDAEAHIVRRSDLAYIILNRYPYNSGHLMIVPNAHKASPEELEPQALAEMTRLMQLSMRVLREAYDPEGFNVGMNVGAAAGAGVADHVHLHIVPRWSGDTNYMPVLAETRVIPEWIDRTYERLRPLFDQIDASPQAE